MTSDHGDRSSVSLMISLFAASAIWFIRRLRKTEELERQRTGPERRRGTIVRESRNISARGIAALSPPIPYLSAFFKCLENPCHAKENPTGYIALCVAENKLVTDLIAERMLQAGTAPQAFSHSEVYNYNSFLGLPVARQAAAYFLAKQFLFPDSLQLTPEQALEHIRPEHVAIGSGCAPLLNYLFYILGEAGDACLIPAPYYAAFENDMSAIAGCEPFAFYMANPSLGPTVNELDIAYIQARSQGLRVKFLLLTNPNNPLGVIYPPEIILNAVKWARKRNMQTIVDEIYALSTHKKFDHKFQSVIRVLDNELGNDVHMLWALSKDFGASGFRIGVLYSQNSDFLEALGNLSIFSGVSQPMQMIAAEILTDDTFVDSFLDLARHRLRTSYEICIAKLEEMVVPFIPADAGLFVYVDLSSLLPEKTFDGESKLSDLITEHARIVLTPGESQRERTPGMFRICYSWVPPEVLEIAMERLSRLAGKIRKMDWSDLNTSTLSSVVNH